MDSKRPFNTNPSTSQGSEYKPFSTDLFFKIGTRVASITAVYERVTPERQALPVPPPIRDTYNEDSDGYVIPKSIMKK